ncbi:hypothetical protein ACQY0O_007493 [Thecaphora frezii]
MSLPTTLGSLRASLSLTLARPLSTTSRRLHTNAPTPAPTHPQLASQLHSNAQAPAPPRLANTPTPTPALALADARNEQTFGQAFGVLSNAASQVSGGNGSSSAAGASLPLASDVPSTPASVLGTTAPLYTPTTLPPRTDALLELLTNLLLKDGKKAQSQRIVARMLAHLGRITHASPLGVLQEAVEAVRPLVKMQSRKQGGKTLQVPIALTQRQSTRKALVWMLEASKKRADRQVEMRIAAEVLAVLEGSSGVAARRDEAHRIAMANRANASVRI